MMEANAVSIHEALKYPQRTKDYPNALSAMVKAKRNPKVKAKNPNLKAKVTPKVLQRPRVKGIQRVLQKTPSKDRWLLARLNY